MTKSFLVFFIPFFIFISGCGSILVRPAVDNVKNIAIVSIYMNKDFYNIKSPRAQEGQIAFKNLLGKTINKATDGLLDKLSNKEEEEQLITYALKVYGDKLGTFGRWQLAPVNQVINNKKYKGLMEPKIKGGFAKGLVSLLQEERNSHWVTPKGMHYIPLSAVAQSGTHYYAGDAKNPTEDARKALAELCKELNVDGVALIELDMGYRFGKVAKVTIGKTTHAKPSISSSIVVVNRNGEVAVNTGSISIGAGTRYEGKSAGMVRNNKIFLKQKDNKIVEVFNQAIEKSAEGTQQTLAKAFKKLK